MPADRKGLTMDQGDTFRLSLQYRDSNDVPVDLTGYRAWLNIRVWESNAGVVAPVIRKTNAVIQPDGWIITTISDEETHTYPKGKTEYNFEIENEAGEINRLLFGTLNVRGEFNG